MSVDVERLVSGWLRTRPAVTDLVAQRVYTELPKTPTWPLIRLRLAPSPEPLAAWQGSVLSHSPAVLQIEAYGGPKVLARQIIDVASLEIARYLPGVQDLGVVTGVSFGGVAWVPDDDGFTPPQPRYLREVLISSRST